MYLNSSSIYFSSNFTTKKLEIELLNNNCNIYFLNQPSDIFRRDIVSIHNCEKFYKQFSNDLNFEYKNIDLKDIVCFVFKNEEFNREFYLNVVFNSFIKLNKIDQVFHNECRELFNLFVDIYFLNYDLGKIMSFEHFLLSLNFNTLLIQLEKKENLHKLREDISFFEKFHTNDENIRNRVLNYLNTHKKSNETEIFFGHCLTYFSSIFYVSTINISRFNFSEKKFFFDIVLDFSKYDYNSISIEFYCNILNNYFNK